LQYKYFIPILPIGYTFRETSLARRENLNRMNPYASGSIVDLSFHRGGKQKSQFKISMQTPVENPLMTIESFNRQFQIGEKEREAVKWGWEQEMGNTMFHVVNAYTRAAEFEGLSAEAGYRLQRLGGMVLGMVK
jgi:hypothetical protein